MGVLEMRFGDRKLIENGMKPWGNTASLPQNYNQLSNGFD